MSTSALELFAQIRRSLNLLAVNALKPLEIGPKQMVMLLEMDRYGELSCGAVARRTDSDPAAISRALGALEKAGWVARSRDRQDKRQWLVKLSASGKKRIPQLRRIVEILSSEFVRDLTRAEVEQLMHLMGVIASGLKGRVNSDEMMR